MPSLRLLVCPRFHLSQTCLFSASSPSYKDDTYKYKYFQHRQLVPPEKYTNVTMPEKWRLPIMPKAPSVWANSGVKPPKQTKEHWRMKGEETVHTDLQLGQFGIVATTGGMMRPEHFDVLRQVIGKGVDPKKTFAMYRVDAPYKPITSHGRGKKMGGGKGSIETYGTPIRAGRIILEVGGRAHWEEVKPFLEKAAGKMPFGALAVNATILKNLRDEEQRLVETNKNPYTFEWLVRNNMNDCQRKLSNYDKIWFGKFVYLDRKLNQKWQLVTGSRIRGKR